MSFLNQSSENYIQQPEVDAEITNDNLPNKVNASTLFLLWTRYATAISFASFICISLISLFIAFVIIMYFNLVSRHNLVEHQQLFIDDKATLTASNYVPTNPTRIYIHGFSQNAYGYLSLRARDGIVAQRWISLLMEKYTFLSL